MIRPLLKSAAFVRAAKRLVKKRPESAETIRHILAALTADPFEPSLRTHKLKGKLSDSWACSAGYDLRIIFEFVQRDDGEWIHVLSVGTHDQIY